MFYIAAKFHTLPYTNEGNVSVGRILQSKCDKQALGFIPQTKKCQLIAVENVFHVLKFWYSNNVEYSFMKTSEKSLCEG